MKRAAKETNLVTWSTPSMGGRLAVSVVTERERDAEARAAARHAGRRVNAWAERLTRFSPSSDLSLLNGSDEPTVSIRPTLGAALEWAQVAGQRTGGVVDATMLDARLAAESGADPGRVRDTSWQILPCRRSRTVQRAPGVAFDLDGLAKGWLADRAVALLSSWAGAAVDADGDIALRADAGVEWLIDVEDPRARSSAAQPLVTLRIHGGEAWTQNFGVATSGTSVHRWELADGRAPHHLIDPRTRRPAQTDVVQCTVLAPSAREAEVIAKSAVIVGSSDALPMLDRSAALAAVLLLESGAVACLPRSEAWLA